MTSARPLSVLDMSPVHRGRTPDDALQDTVTLARACAGWGYHRYWVAEHHGMPALALASPEILISHLAHELRDSSMRIGTGGVMLRHYSPLKVAEVFRVLSSLYPGRIDLGIGSAAGAGDGHTAALAFGRRVGLGMAHLDYPKRVEALIKHVRSSETEDEGELLVVPRGAAQPELWILGTSEGSAKLAGARAMNYVIGLFTGGGAPNPECVEAYRDALRKREGRVMLAVGVVCSEDPDEARRLVRTGAGWMAQGVACEFANPLQAPEDINPDEWSPVQQSMFQRVVDATVLGTPSECRARIDALAEQYDADEIMAVTMTHDFEPRLRSHELLAREYGLAG